ncbi:MAG: pyruvate kinase, partial [Chitinivibrionales bacterium]|nr:pyruvate kinase [Chitinivibrionales bacterium]
MHKKAKIIATVGPACNSEACITRLLKSGANIFRLNFSHGTHADHAAAIRRILSCSNTAGYEPAILADLQGPKIRTGRTPGDKPVYLTKGSTVVLSGNNGPCDARRISISFAGLHRELAVGQRVLINDGAIALRVSALNRAAREVSCVVQSGGAYSSHKGVNFPDVNLSIAAFTPKDRVDLRFVLRGPAGMVAMSFVRSAADLRPLIRQIR